MTGFNGKLSVDGIEVPFKSWTNEEPMQRIQINGQGQMKVVRDLVAEREYQDKKWGGADHDDAHSLMDWWSFMAEYHKKALAAETPEERYKMLVKVTAIGMAMCESQLRQKPAERELTNEQAEIAMYRLISRRPEIAKILQYDGYVALTPVGKLQRLARDGHISPTALRQVLPEDMRQEEQPEGPFGHPVLDFLQSLLNGAPERDPGITELNPTVARELMEGDFSHAPRSVLHEVVSGLRSYARCLSLACQTMCEQRDEAYRDASIMEDEIDGLKRHIEELKKQRNEFRDEMFRDQIHKSQAERLVSQNRELQELRSRINGMQGEINHYRSKAEAQVKVLEKKDSELEVMRQSLRELTGIANGHRDNANKFHKLSGDYVVFLQFVQKHPELAKTNDFAQVAAEIARPADTISVWQSLYPEKVS